MPIRSRSYLPLLVVTLAVLVPNQALAQTSRLERVLANKELRACIWPEYYSISYRNPKTRELR
ncbi:MAG: Cyclohexadienyl dehydratase precursor [Pseudomonadota bacterium]